MNFGDTPNLFVLGVVIGLTSAMLGAIIDFRLAKRRSDSDKLPGCIFMVTGSLGFTGFLLLIFYALFEGSLRRPLVTGGGVVTGFVLGFLIMLAGWFILYRKRN